MFFNIKSVRNLSLVVALSSHLVACGDEDDSSAKEDDDTGAEDAATAADAGAADSAQADASQNSAQDSAVSMPLDAAITNSSSPCPYAVSGGQSFPGTDATFFCTNNSRILQAKGQGTYTLLLGAGLSTKANDSSTMSCTLTSATAPKAGDVWTLASSGTSGRCELSYQQGTTTTIWEATSAPAVGAATVTFVSATLMHGTSKPEDVYYVFEVTYTATLKGKTAGAPDVTLTGSYKTTMLPLGA